MQVGKGGIDLVKPHAECNSSGFVAWSIRIPRELPPKSNKWLDTNIYYSGRKSVKTDLFIKIDLIGNYTHYKGAVRSLSLGQFSNAPDVD